ncbi:hypothetical protein BKA70DRAFT_1290817 [Coprinopsis sp. MPI-PUGE-AT-0042]|nr:hypothetical protein BKA70DRAFT_1290817 [Coprinopsis sp. MPI-PUGE-AT-0042]
MSSIAPRIPTDIAFQIIEFGDDFTALKSTSLVCKIWRDHSQRRLFRNLKLTVRSTGDSSIRRLEGLGLASSMRIRQYVRIISLTLLAEDGRDVIVAWLNMHEQLLVRLLKMLPLDRISSFFLFNLWPIWDHVVEEQELVPQFPSIAGCVEDMCASAMLRTLSIRGYVPFSRLLRPPFLPTRNPPRDPTPNGQVSINLERLMLVNPGYGTAQKPNASLVNYLLDPRRSLVNLGSLRELGSLGDLHLEEPVRQLFEACAGTLESLRATVFPSSPSSRSKISRLGLRKAGNLKRLDFYFHSSYNPSRSSRLTEFLKWLVEELTSDQKQGGANQPSNLERVELGIFVFSSVKDIDVTQVGALAEILSDRRLHPNIKEVDLLVRVSVHPSGSSSVENEHKEKLESALGALKERGVLRLRW